MNRKMIIHGIMITAIVIATFVAAALTPADTYAKTSEVAAVANIAKIDFDNRTLRAGGTVISDNEVPLAAVPFETDMNKAMGYIIISASAIMAAIVIIEGIKDRQ